LRIVLVGQGVVGRGLADQLTGRRRELRARGLDLKVVAAVDSKGAVVDSGGIDLARLLSSKKKTGRIGPGNSSALEVIRSVDADALVELTPGTQTGEPALSHIRAALKSSKSVVTANKMPLALHYVELLRDAEKRGLKILYGACVGGGLPVLDFGTACAAAEPVDLIEGVVNATTSFILTEMERGQPFGKVLRKSQKLGYAEPDPSFDIEGVDAACKVVILANHVMGKQFRLKDVKPMTGIAGVTSDEAASAMRKGKPLRLLARAGRSLSVRLAGVEKGSPLAVQGRSHAVVFHCRYSGERAITGRGAGSVTTSLGVLRDLIALARGAVA